MYCHKFETTLLHTLQPTKIEKWDIEPKPCASHNHEPEISTKLRLGLLGFKGMFFIAEFITIDL